MRTEMRDRDAGRAAAAGDIEIAARLTRQLVMLESLVRRAKPGRSEVALKSAWLPLLMKLAEEGPQRAGKTAASLCMSPSTISRQVAVLVRSGLIERRADPGDGRASLLAATATGRRMLDAERRRRAAQYIDALAGWPPEARGRFADLLGYFVGDLQLTRKE